MKKISLIMVAALALTLCFALFGCSAQESKEENTVSYSPSEVDLGKFHLVVKSASVEYDESNETDALVFTLEATNNYNEAMALESVLNIRATQNNDGLNWAYGITNTTGEFALAAEGSDENLESGKSGEYKYAFLLKNNETPVAVTFDSYTSGIEGGGTVEFDVTGKQSAGAKEAEQTAANAEQEKADAIANGEKTTKIADASITLPEEWSFTETADNEATAKNADDAEILMKSSSSYDDAKKWAESTNKNFNDGTVKEYPVGNASGYALTFSDKPDMWFVYVDTSNGPVSISSADLSIDDAKSVIDGVAIS